MVSKSKLKNKQIRFSVSYGRVSTIGQTQNKYGVRAEDGSPEAQKNRCLEFVQHLEQKTGASYSHIEHISDEGFSGKNTKRPGYLKLWDLISAKKIDLVIATELSRLNRSVRDFLEFVDHCKIHDVDIAILGLDLDTSTAQGKMMVVVFAALAQFERETTGQRVKENARMRLLTDGKINGAGEILGLDRDPSNPGHFIRNDEELRIVTEIFKQFLKLPSKKKLVSFLNERGTTGKYGRKISTHMIDIILKNAEWRYRGLWHINLENKDVDPETLPESKRYQVVTLPHGPLIDEDLLDKVLQKIDDTYSTHKRTGRDNYTYLLTNVLKFEDETRFTGEIGKGNGGVYRYYRNVPNDLRVRCDEIDMIICNRIKSYIKDQDEFGKLVESALKQRQMELPRIDNEMHGLKGKLQDLDKTETNLRNQLLDSSKTADPSFMKWLEKQVEHLIAEKRQKENELEMLKRTKSDILKKVGLTDIKATIREFVDDFDKLTGTEKRNLLEKIVRRVTVKRNNELEIEVFGEPSGGKGGGGGSSVNERNTGSVKYMNGSQGRD